MPDSRNTKPVPFTKGEGPLEYTARVWCTRHGKVDPEGSELCNECNHLLFTKGGYRASDRHGSRAWNRGEPA
jgi:hypothetical protein